MFVTLISTVQSKRMLRLAKASGEHRIIRQGTQWTCPTYFQAWIAVLLHAHCLPKLTMASVDNQNRTSDDMITKEAVKEGYLTSHSKSASWKKNKASLLHNRRVLPNLLRSALRMQQGIVPFLQKLRTYITTMVLATGPDSPASSIGWSKTLLLLHLPHGRVDLTQDSSLFQKDPSCTWMFCFTFPSYHTVFPCLSRKTWGTRIPTSYHVMYIANCQRSLHYQHITYINQNSPNFIIHPRELREPFKSAPPI